MQTIVYIFSAMLIPHNERKISYRGRTKIFHPRISLNPSLKVRRWVCKGRHFHEGDSKSEQTLFATKGRRAGEVKRVNDD